MNENVISVDEFIKHYTLHSNAYMWFIGAGVSRSASIPTASDIIREIKVYLYCLETGDSIDSFRIFTDAVLDKINGFFSMKPDYPSLYSDEEYSFYLEKYFGSDREAQQKYFNEKVITDVLSIGHKILAALMASAKVKAVITTNFDNVIERAYSSVTDGKILEYVYSLDGSADAINAVNNDDYRPIYLKIHGDYRYTNIKNLSKDLVSQNESLMKAFSMLSSRYGIIFSGYSGRDASVMKQLDAILDSEHPFPQGIFWLVESLKDVPESVNTFINKAKNKNITAKIVIQSGVFDNVMRALGRNIKDIPDALLKKIREQNLGLPVFNVRTGNTFPVIRTNAYKIVEFPKTIQTVDIDGIKTYTDIKNNKQSIKLLCTKLDRVYFFGDSSKINLRISNLEEVELTDDLLKQKLIQNLLQRTILYSLSKKKALKISNINSRYFIFINESQKYDDTLSPIRKLTREKLVGSFANGVKWVEALETRITRIDDSFYLIVFPTIWIPSFEDRRRSTFFIKALLRPRSNKLLNSYLNAWGEILFGKNPSSILTISPYEENSQKNPTLKILSTTSFSRQL